MTPDDRKQIVFGGFDGLTSAVGLIVALVLSAHTGTLVIAVAGLAVASAVGMGAGEWLGDSESDFGRALVMAAATAVGAFLPAIPFLFLARWPGAVVAMMISLATAVSIGRVRGRGARGYVETLGITSVAVALSVAVSLFLGAV